MITNYINSFADVGTSSGNTNYIVRSSLSSGQSHSCASTISTKMVIAGSETYTTSGVRYPINSSQFLMAIPGVDYELTIDSSATGCCFFFDLSYINRLMSEMLSKDLEGGDNRELEIDTIRLPLVGSELGQLMSSIAQKRIEPDSDRLTTALVEYTCYLSRLSAELPCQRESTKKELLARLEVARSYLIDAGNRTVTLAELERAACLSRYYLIRAFTLVYGVPPLRFQQNQKLAVARQKIKAGIPMKVLAEQLGFTTPSSFSRAYRRRHNCSPTDDQAK